MGCTDGHVRQRPHGGKSIAWLIWHAARVDEADFNAMVTHGLLASSRA